MAVDAPGSRATHCVLALVMLQLEWTLWLPQRRQEDF